jgi:hypothetical protein
LKGDVPVNETGSFELAPGVYTTTATAECGSKTYSVDITEHVSREVKYSCVVNPR